MENAVKYRVRIGRTGVNILCPCSVWQFRRKTVKYRTVFQTAYRCSITGNHKTPFSRRPCKNKPENSKIQNYQNSKL